MDKCTFLTRLGLQVTLYMCARLHESFADISTCKHADEPTAIKFTDGNGYPLPAYPVGFYPVGWGFGKKVLPMGK